MLGDRVGTQVGIPTVQMSSKPSKAVPHVFLSGPTVFTIGIEVTSIAN
jgi:hypothetical protein